MKKKDVLDQALEYLTRVPTATAEVNANKVKEKFRASLSAETPAWTVVQRWADGSGLTVGSDNPENPELATVYRFKRKPVEHPETTLGMMGLPTRNQ